MVKEKEASERPAAAVVNILSVQNERIGKLELRLTALEGILRREEEGALEELLP